MDDQATTVREARDEQREPFSTDLFLVLEGGGAKALAHVAAWKVLDRLVDKPKETLATPLPADLGRDRFKLRGVAGTSAGAIVAAFIAAGAKAEDLIDDDGQVPLCEALHIRHFRDIFSVAEWRRLKFIRRLKSPTGRIDSQARKFIWKATQGTDHSVTPFSTADVEVRSTLSESAFVRILYLCVIISAALFFWIDNVDMFKSKGAEGAVFLLFWTVSNALFIATSYVLRKWERRKYRTKNRYFADWKRAFFHPWPIMIVSLLTTFLAAKYFASLTSVRETYLTFVNFYVSPLGYEFHPGLLTLWLSCGLASAITIIALVRRALKGTVNSINLQRDLNEALKSIIGKTINRLLLSSTSTSTSLTRLVLRMKSDEYKITFNDLRLVTDISLSVITSDVIGNKVHVISTESDPECYVADAVTGSISIPFAFCFVRLQERLLFDGGLISSIPAWVYRRHRTRDPDCRILAIGIEPAKYDTWIPTFLSERRKELQRWREKAHWKATANCLETVGVVSVFCRAPIASLFWPVSLASNVATTALFGGRSLDLDASDRLDNFSLRPRVGLLDFDLSSVRAKFEIGRLQAIAKVEIENLLWRRKVAFQKVGQLIEDKLRALGDKRQPNVKVRVFWAAQDGTSKAVRIRFTYGFAPQDLDDRLVLPFESSMTAWAAELEYSQFATREVLDQLMRASEMNRYRALVKWDRKWCWAIPVRDKEVFGVLAIEASEDLSCFDSSLGKIASARSKAWLDDQGKLNRSEGKIAKPEKWVASDLMTQLEQEWATHVLDLFTPTMVSKS